MATKMTREEAIKIVQSATVWTDEERDALAMLIPELTESEEERIRKALIKLMTVAGEQNIRINLHNQRLRDAVIVHIEREDANL